MKNKLNVSVNLTCELRTATDKPATEMIKNEAL